jgi:hypothetical protein
MSEHEPEAAQPPVEGPSSSAPPPADAPTVGPPAVPPPIVAWETTAAPTPTQDGWPIGITIGGVLSDTFARYAADPIRIFLVGLVPAVLAFLAAGSGTTFPLVLLSLLSTSVILVLADRGPRTSLRYAAGLGLRRTGWLLLTAIVLGLVVVLIAGIPLNLILAVFGPSPVVAGFLILLVAIAIAWVFMRLVLAIPAVVVDDLNTSGGLGRAREATRGLGAVLSVLVVLVVVNIAVLPAGLGAGALVVATKIPSWLILLVGGVLVAIVTPLGTIAQLSAYRRAFPPEPEPPPKERPSWLQNPVADELSAVTSAAAVGADASTAAVAPFAPPPVAAPIPSPEAAAPPPAFGRVARGIAGLTIAIGILGVGAFGFAIFSSVAGSLGNTAGNVPAGTVAFGSQGSLQSCSVYGQATTMPAKTDTVFIGRFRRPATSSDEVRLRVSLDGTEIINEVEKRGSYVCLGSDTPETDIEAGTYDFSIYLNDELTAEGTLIVR